MKNENGFTLIELLVTVSIVALLASIAIPQFTEYREKAYLTELISYGHNSKAAAFSVINDSGHEQTASVVQYIGRAQMTSLPGMPDLPDHIGGYIGGYERQWASGRAVHAISLRLCSTKIEKNGKVPTYRYYESNSGFAVMDGLLPEADAYTTSECTAEF